MTVYTPELANAICEEIACGDSVKVAAEKHGITERCFFKWLAKDKDLIQYYTRARETRSDARFEYSSELMEELRIDVLTPEKARIMLDGIKWKCGKESPRKYGDSTQVKHADANGNLLSLTTVLNEINGQSTDLPDLKESSS